MTVFDMQDQGTLWWLKGASDVLYNLAFFFYLISPQSSVEKKQLGEIVF